jgi:hypothetical protein
LSEESIFLALGDGYKVSQLAGKDQQTYLRDPQRLNSYSYAIDNPIVLKDTTGKDAIGINVGIAAEGGLGVFGALTLNAGLTLVYNPDTGQRWVVPTASFGGNAGALGSYISYPSSGGKFPTVFGAVAGGNVGLNYSPNANSPTDIGGDQSSLNINVGPLSVAGQGLQTNMPSYSVGFGPGLGASMSFYPVRTWTGAPLANWYGATQPQMQSMSNPASRQTGSSNGGGSYATVIGLYQQLVSVLSSLVSTMKASDTR